MFRLCSRRLFAASTPSLAAKTVNSVTLVGVVHDIQSGFVYENAVTQFTLTTTSLDTSNPTQECVVEKDHHTVRCFGETFSNEVKDKIKEGNVICVNGRLRLNPQLEPSCNKHFYFPFLHVEPPHGSYSVVHGDRRKAPEPASSTTAEVPAAAEGTGEAAAAASDAPAAGESNTATPAAAEEQK